MAWRNPHSSPSPPRWAAASPGRLLVATTKLGDPNFERAVVLVLDHGDEGALGVVLNRPTLVPVGRVPCEPRVEQARLAAKRRHHLVFRGGPVSPDAVIGLARAATLGAAIGGRGVPWLARRWAPVDPSGAAWTLPARRAEWPAYCLLSGYSGWAPDQLEAELGEGAWFVLAAPRPP